MAQAQGTECGEMRIVTHGGDFPVGHITRWSDGRALRGLWLEGQKYFATGVPADAVEAEDGADEITGQAVTWLDAYFAGDDPGLSPRLSLEGTPFQKAVWRQACAVSKH